MAKIYTYFVSYFYRLKDQSTGYGNMYVDVAAKITERDQIETMRKSIQKTKNAEAIVILNFIELGSAADKNVEITFCASDCRRRQCPFNEMHAKDCLDETGYANFEDMHNGCPDYRPPKEKSSEEKEATE